MLDYNGAEKGCSGTKEGVVMMLTALVDGPDAYLSGGKEFNVLWHLFAENDRRACCPNIVGHPAK